MRGDTDTSLEHLEIKTISTMTKFLVSRYDGSKRIVSIMVDRATNKYCFVNLTTGHVCACRFDTYEEALDDMDKNDKITAYFKLPNEE